MYGLVAVFHISFIVVFIISIGMGAKKKRKCKWSTSLRILVCVCFLILHSFAMPETTRDATIIESTEADFVQSSLMGTHIVEVHYYQAYIYDDHDPNVYFEGEWKFGLCVEDTWDYTNYLDRDGPGDVYFDLVQIETISSSTYFEFEVYAGEWDQDIQTMEWSEDYFSMWTFHTQSNLEMNTWHTDVETVGDVIHYVKYYITNLHPVASSIEGGTTLQWQGITMQGAGYDPDGDGATFQWDSDYDGVSFDAEYYSSSSTISYDAPGTYTVGFRLVDDFGEASYVQTATVTVLADNDGDGIIDSEDDDDDNDGLLDVDEISIHGTNPLNPDTDFDDLTDFEEVDEFGPGTDPLNPDSDFDGLEDGEEINLQTDPKNPDTDGDGASDGDEVNVYNTDPRDPNSAPPSVTVCINDGDTHTGSTRVHLTIEAIDSDGISGIRFRNGGGGWSEWVSYTQRMIWTLPSGNGLKVVYVQAMDGAGDIGEGSDDIILEITMGEHLVEVLYYQAYIYDDHDPNVYFEGEWKFGLCVEDTWDYTNYLDRDGPGYVYFDLTQEGTVSYSTYFQFDVYSGEWDEIVPGEWTEDYSSTWTFSTSSYLEMNRWYPASRIQGDVKHFVEYIVYNFAPVANPILGDTVYAGESIAFEGYAIDPERDSIGLQWDMDYGSSFTIDACSQSPVFAYTTPGTYTVAFRAIDLYGATSEIQTATVVVLADIDTDGDGISNSMDDDDDNDGLLDVDEESLGTDPLSPDTDNDGFSDADEVLVYFSNPLMKGPIYIDENADFKAFGFEGEGTQLEPFIIENLVIETSTINLIHIQDTTAYFEIRNCELDGLGGEYYGIYLLNVQNANVSWNIVQNCYTGYMLENTHNSSLEHNWAHHTSYDYHLTASKENTLSWNRGTTCSVACYLLDADSSNNTLSDNTADQGFYCYHVVSSSNNTFLRNTATDTDTCFFIESSFNNTLRDNTLLGGMYGFRLEDCRNHTLSGNTMYFSTYAYYLKDSEYNTLEANDAEEAVYGFYLLRNSFNEISDNIVTGCENGITLENCEYNRLSGNTISNCWIGIDLNNVDECNITGNHVEVNHVGIALVESRDSTLLDNDVFYSSYAGFVLTMSSDCLVEWNNASGCLTGFQIEVSSSNLLSHNTVIIDYTQHLVFYRGFWLLWSDKNTLFDNIVIADVASTCYSFSLENSNENTLTRNNITSKIDVYVLEYSHSCYGFNVDTSHGNDIRYNNISISFHYFSEPTRGYAYGVYLFSSQNCTISNNDIRILMAAGNGNTEGYDIYLLNCWNTTIAFNNVTSDLGSGIGFGIYLHISSNTIILDNILLQNDNGVYLRDSSYNLIYHNMFLDNQHGAFLSGTCISNYWHHQILLEGNFWSDYLGFDDGSGTGKHALAGDGIGDTELPAAGLDNYPLIEPLTTLTTVYQDENTEVTVAFHDVSETGTTEVVVSDTGPDPEQGFRLVGQYYDITSTVSCSGTITIAIPYDESAVENEALLLLEHWDEDLQQWVDVTTWVDTENNIIFGETTSLSKFALMELTHIYIDGDDDFRTQAAKYGWPGSGTDISPFIINGFVFSDSEFNLIHVQDTTVYFEIHNCELDGLTQDYYGMYLLNVQNAKVSDNVIENCKVGIFLHAIQHSIIERNWVHNCVTGINLRSTSNLLLSNNQVYDNSVYGINVHSVDSAIFSDNTISDNAQFGLYIYNSNSLLFSKNLITRNEKYAFYLDRSIDIQFCENTVSHNSRMGVFLARSNHTLIAENSIHDNQEHGIQFSVSCDNTIIGNTIYSNIASGIYLGGSSSNILSHNTIYGNSGRGICLYGGTGNILSDNDVYDNMQIGIYMDNSKNTTFSYNMILNNGHYGILIQSACNNTFSWNTISDNANIGFFLYVSCKNNTIFSNTVYNNAGLGIYLYNDSSNNTISSNTISNQQNHVGIQLSVSSNNNTLFNNTISQNYCGIRVTTGSNYNILMENTVTDNRNLGISIEDSSFNQLTGNQVTGCPTGFLLYIGRNNTLSGNTFELLNHDASLNQIFGFHLSWCPNTTLSGNIVNIPISVSVVESMDVHIAGFYLQWCSNATIIANIIDISVSFFGQGSSNPYGFIMLACYDCKLIGNSVTLGFQGDVFGYYMGMHLEWSHRNSLSGNEISISAVNPPANFEAFCIRMIQCEDNILSGNAVLYDATGHVVGIYLGWSDHNEVYGNMLTGCEDGIGLLNCEDNIVSGNTVASCFACGINLVDCANIALHENTVIDCHTGIGLWNGHHNTLFGNWVDVIDYDLGFDEIIGVLLSGCQNCILTINSVTFGIEHGSPSATYSFESGSLDGFVLDNCDNATLTTNKVRLWGSVLGSLTGFSLTACQNHTLSRNKVEFIRGITVYGDGFSLLDCHNNTLVYNDITFSGVSNDFTFDGSGFSLLGCHNNTVSENDVLFRRIYGFADGFSLESCHNNMITDNEIFFQNNFFGSVSAFSLEGCYNNTLVGNEVITNGFRISSVFDGFSLSGCHNNTIIGNGILFCWERSLGSVQHGFHSGFSFSSCHNNTLINNIVQFYYLASGVMVSGDGFLLSGCQNNVLLDNLYLFQTSAHDGVTVSVDGFLLSGCQNNMLTGNLASINLEIQGGVFNGAGYHLFECQSNTLLNNSVDLQGIIDNGVFNGFCLEYSSVNSLTNNTATNNYHGFYLTRSSANTLINNTATSNAIGFCLLYCVHTIIDGLEGASKIEGGNGELAGVMLYDCSDVTIRDYWIRGFETGIEVHSCTGGTISVNHMIDNSIAVSLARTTQMTIVRNIFSENDIGLQADFSSIDNNIYLNLFMSNGQQVCDTGSNTWHFIDTESGQLLGNFWNNYLGLDDGSGGRVEGDGIGDTNLPHEEVDDFPLIDPSIAMKYGPLPIGNDWWQAGGYLIWRGGWSLVEIKVTDPLGHAINSTTNEIGLNAWYFEEIQADGTTNVLVMIVVPVPLNPYPQEVFTFEMTALDDLTYSMEWFVSYGDSVSGIGGEVLFIRTVEDAPLTAGQTRLVETELEMTPEGVEVSAVAQYDFGGFLRPIKPDGTSWFKQGMSIPVKFQLFDEDGNPDSTAHATLDLAMVIDGVVGDFMPADSTSPVDTSNVFRYDEKKEQYVFNLNTMDLAAGIYVLRITLDDGQQFTIQIEIR